MDSVSSSVAPSTACGSVSICGFDFSSVCSGAGSHSSNASISLGNGAVTATISWG